MVGHILTEVFLIDDDRDEAQDDTGMTVGVTMQFQLSEYFLNKEKIFFESEIFNGVWYFRAEQILSFHMEQKVQR